MARRSLEVLSTRGRDRERWRQCLAALPADKGDVFYLPEYSALYEDVYGEPAFMIRYGDDRSGVLMVVAKRGVSDLPFYRSGRGSPLPVYHDLTSPYGYGGPVVYGCDPDEEPELFSSFRSEFHDYCVANGVVTEFLRLHPLMQNHLLFGEDSCLYQKNETVWIDLRDSPSVIYQGMRKNHRRNIRRATDEGVEVAISDLRAEDVKDFYRLYTSRMEELSALPVFFFPIEFFQEAAATLRGHMACFLATWKGKVVSAYLFLRYGPYIHNFLSGSDSEHWDLKANALTVYKAALWAKEQGCQFFHLGGGHAVQTDGVFQFKSQFSTNRAPYYMYRYVHNPEAYQALGQMKREYDRQDALNDADITTSTDPLLTDYFPTYRA